MRSILIVTLTLVCLACTDRTVVSNDNTTTTNGDGDGDATGETGPDGDLPSTSGDGDGEPSDNACGCEEGQLCVGDCSYGDFDPDEVENPRCIDDAICFEHGFDSPECMELACDAPWSEPLGVCGDSADYNIICEPSSPPPSCYEIDQDCPDNEKCVPRLPDRWGYSTARCVPVVDVGAPGDPCSSQGADPASEGTDSCDFTSMCWNGALTAEPFEGICRPFCEWENDELTCPEGLTCEWVIAPDTFRLCVPSP